MDRHSLKSRLLVRTALATALILLAAAAVIYGFVRASLLAEFDASLASSAKALAAMAEQDGDQVKLEGAESLQDFHRSRRPDYFAIWSLNGKLVNASQAAAGQLLPRPAFGNQAPAYADIPLGAEAGRQVVMTIHPAGEDHVPPAAGVASHPATLVVARHRHDLDERLKQLALLLTCVVSAATIVAAFVMWLVVRGGLRPLGSLAAQIETIGESNLDERVDLAGAPLELRAVVARLNDLLDRVGLAVTRERRFTADVAHELRTPLAGLAATLDVCASRRRTTAEYERALGRCTSIVRSMHSMVDNLLTLARADAGQLKIERRPVSLSALIRDCWSSFGPAAAARSLSEQVIPETELAVQTDPGLLRIVLNNLLDNAVSHADDGGWLRAEVTCEGERAVLHLRNSGCVLDAEQIDRVIDRFWRADNARTGGGTHCGLGLSLCSEIAPLIGGSLTVAVEGDGVFRASLALPLAEPVSAAGTAHLGAATSH